jgi:hypothetical protein
MNNEMHDFEMIHVTRNKVDVFSHIIFLPVFFLTQRSRCLHLFALALVSRWKGVAMILRGSIVM